LSSAALEQVVNIEELKSKFSEFIRRKEYKSAYELIKTSNHTGLIKDAKTRINSFHIACGAGDIGLAMSIHSSNQYALNSITNWNSNAFHIACQFGHIQMAEKLLELNPEFLNSLNIYIMHSTSHVQTVKKIQQSGY